MSTTRPLSKRSKRMIVASVLAALGIVLIGAAQLIAGPAEDFFDANARAGQAPYKSQDEMQAELNRVVEEGMFNISIASVIPFEDGTAPGKAYIENVPGNRYVMKVAIALDDTGETVFESGGLKPGTYLEDITLTRDLERGDHLATAVFTAFDPDTLEEAGRAAAQVTLLVQR